MPPAESQLEDQLIQKLQGLKYEYRSDIRDRAALEKNFREKFEALNRVCLTDAEFARLLDEIITPDVLTAARAIRSINAFTRDDGTPLNYTLVNLKDWCKNSFEVINQLRINTDNSHHRYDVILLINGVPVVQIELKTLGISPRRAMEQIVEYKNDPGNGYTRTLLCFMQLFIVSNQDRTYYFASNNARHFAFNADTALRGSAIPSREASLRSLSTAKDNRFLPIYRFADRDNHLAPQGMAGFVLANGSMSSNQSGEGDIRRALIEADLVDCMVALPDQLFYSTQIPVCVSFGGKNNTLDSANDARLFDGETELSWVA